MNPFRPLPLLGNPHVQTILGNLLTGIHRTIRVRKHAVRLPDGDRIVLHETMPRRENEQAPVAVLIHGLGGSHRSPYQVRMTNRLYDLGWRVARMDLRGAGAGLRQARRFYHAGCSDDLRAVLDHLAARFPDARLAVIGYSLGGNIALKLAGEYSGSPLHQLAAVAAIAPPIDLIRCSQLMSGYPFYDRFYARALIRQVREHQRHHADVPAIDFPPGASLRQFDELYTAPRWGYSDALDYYRRASAEPWIERIAVPTFVLTARDDPYVAVEPFERLHAPPAVEVHIAEQGGHGGFLGHDGQGGIRWAETHTVQWLARQITFARPPDR